VLDILMDPVSIPVSARCLDSTSLRR